MRVHPAGCGCDETGCEYSRVRDAYEIKVLWNLPQSHINAKKDDDNWCNTLRKAAGNLRGHQHTFPVPPCPECETDPWVVLATVSFSTNSDAASHNGNQVAVQFNDRRVLLATQRLQVAALCLP